MSVEPMRASSVVKGQGGGLEQRVTALETRMYAVETNLETAVNNTAELLSIVKATKGVAAFAKKHGPRAVAFVTGTLAAAGVGNPAVWKFIGSFFE